MTWSRIANTVTETKGRERRKRKRRLCSDETDRELSSVPRCPRFKTAALPSHGECLRCRSRELTCFCIAITFTISFLPSVAGFLCSVVSSFRFTYMYASSFLPSLRSIVDDFAAFLNSVFWLQENRGELLGPQQLPGGTWEGSVWQKLPFHGHRQ